VGLVSNLQRRCCFVVYPAPLDIRAPNVRSPLEVSYSHIRNAIVTAAHPFISYLSARPMGRLAMRDDGAISRFNISAGLSLPK
jgi:hypothetical protein